MISRKWLLNMLEADEWEDLPEDIRHDLERMNELIDRAKPGCEISSSQIVAMLVLLWEKEQGKE
jgi:hypothetical protein